MIREPVDLRAALAAFDELWAPRIAARVNDYDVRIAKVGGEFAWHRHDDTDEFFLVLSGQLRIALREGNDERAVTLQQGSVFVVPRGVEHKPSSADGASILMFEPTGTVNTGDHHERLPAHIKTTIGHALD
ncbi:cupin domain-containing protein [Nocardia sp. NPDC048505]|uniref:cupin domain-containing protein n=1 Tax=unclassified Nocardia TaxID=2637762 RepID=UPI0033CD0509